MRLTLYKYQIKLTFCYFVESAACLVYDYFMWNAEYKIPCSFLPTRFTGKLLFDGSTLWLYFLLRCAQNLLASATTLLFIFGNYTAFLQTIVPIFFFLIIIFKQQSNFFAFAFATFNIYLQQCKLCVNWKSKKYLKNSLS